MINLGEVDLSLVVVQTHRKALDAGYVQTFGEKMSQDEAARRCRLKYRPLTAPDVPLVQWSEHLEQYFLREDGALVTSNHAVAWGHLGWRRRNLLGSHASCGVKLITDAKTGSLSPF
jgi:hypothetical protein